MENKSYQLGFSDIREITWTAQRQRHRRVRETEGDEDIKRHTERGRHRKIHSHRETDTEGTDSGGAGHTPAGATVCNSAVLSEGACGERLWRSWQTLSGSWGLHGCSFVGSVFSFGEKQ